jgi:hypothetical protein
MCECTKKEKAIWQSVEKLYESAVYSRPSCFYFRKHTKYYRNGEFIYI